jgi:hypothetical protein
MGQILKSVAVIVVLRRRMRTSALVGHGVDALSSCCQNVVVCARRTLKNRQTRAEAKRKGKNGKGVSGEGVRRPPVRIVFRQDNEIDQHSSDSNETDEQEVKDESSIEKNY